MRFEPKLFSADDGAPDELALPEDLEQLGAQLSADADRLARRYPAKPEAPLAEKRVAEEAPQSPRRRWPVWSSWAAAVFLVAGAAIWATVELEKCPLEFSAQESDADVKFSRPAAPLAVSRPGPPETFPAALFYEMSGAEQEAFSDLLETDRQPVELEL